VKDGALARGAAWMADGLGHLGRDPMKGMGGTQMRNVLIAAVALVALAGPAHAAAMHTWYYVDFDNSKCVISLLTPEQKASEIENARISPRDVIKDADGDITVLIHGSFHGTPAVSILYSSKSKCEALFAGPAPDHDDIN
jgi:hypothetical protein